MYASFAPLLNPALNRVPNSGERSFMVALLCSGVLHAIVAVIVTTLLALHASPDPTPTVAPTVFQATLVDVQPPMPQATIEPTREPVPETIVVPVTPSISPQPPPAPAAPRAASAPARPAITSTDPNGSITIGMLDPQILGGGIASTLANRYPARVDREPRLGGGLVLPYPPAAREARVSGRVAAVLDLDEKGKIVGTVLVPNHPLLGPAVAEALKEARFAPGEIAAKPVPYWAIVEFTFAIAAPERTAARPSSTPDAQPAVESTAGAPAR